MKHPISDKFKIISVIELVDNSVLGIKSFSLELNAVKEGKEYIKTVKETEKLFIEKAVLNGAKDKDIESFLEDGRFSRAKIKYFYSDYAYYDDVDDNDSEAEQRDQTIKDIIDTMNNKIVIAKLKDVLMQRKNEVHNFGCRNTNDYLVIYKKVKEIKRLHPDNFYEKLDEYLKSRK